jgi:hypothetical protein
MSLPRTAGSAASNGPAGGSVVATGDAVAVDVDAVDDLVDTEQAKSGNVIMTTRSVALQRVT